MKTMRPMTKPTLLAIALAAVAWPQNQQSNIILKITGGTKSAIALPDFRGAGGASRFAAVFNQTVFGDVQRSGMLEMAAKSFYPLNPPQQEGDLRAPVTAAQPRRGAAPEAPNCNGRCLTDWSSPPLNANYLGFGYLAEQGGQLIAFGHLYNTTVSDMAGAKAFRKLYNGPLTERERAKWPTSTPPTSLPSSACHPWLGRKSTSCPTVAARGQKRSGRWTSMGRISVP